MIRFDERWVKPILDGEKTTTIRSKVTARLGETRAVCRVNGDLFGWIKIIDVKQRKLASINMEKEGFTHWEDAQRYLSEKFPDISVTEHTLFYVIEFKRTILGEPDEAT